MELEAAAPAVPELFRILEGLAGIDRLRIGKVGSSVGKGEPDTIAAAHGKVRDGFEVLAVDGDGGVQEGEMGTGDGADAVVDARHPGHRSTVIKAQGEFHADVQLSADSFNDAHDIGEPLADRHEVDEPD